MESCGPKNASEKISNDGIRWSFRIKGVLAIYNHSAFETSENIFFYSDRIIFPDYRWLSIFPHVYGFVGTRMYQRRYPIMESDYLSWQTIVYPSFSSMVFCGHRNATGDICVDEIVRSLRINGGLSIFPHACCFVGLIIRQKIYLLMELTIFPD